MLQCDGAVPNARMRCESVFLTRPTMGLNTLEETSARSLQSRRRAIKRFLARVRRQAPEGVVWEVTHLANCAMVEWALKPFLG